MIPPPFALVAELTHRCPLQCAYCSNPLALAKLAEELGTADWLRVLDEAAALGVLQLHLTGGEPTARADLADIVAHAAALGLYTNLITAGVTLTDAALARLVDAGIDHIQLSFQGATPDAADAMAVLPGAHERKRTAAARITAAGLPLTANFVIHRGNAHEAAAMIALAEALGAGRIEIAHAQYHGWALRNRAALMPTPEQLAAVTAAVAAARTRLSGRIVIDHVLPDYLGSTPKACMGGWARQTLVVTPAGRALPCHAAESLPDLAYPSVRDRSLAAIWRDDPAFNRFRGTGWMPEPCRSCDRREIDWGGCRCQAHALTGDMAATDPVCALAGQGVVIERLLAEEPQPLVKRRP